MTGGLRRRTPLRSGSGLSRGSGIPRTRTQLNPVSAKRKAENRVRASVVAEMRAAEPWCHARCVRECTNTPDDPHEIVTRARRGSITDPANIILVCRRCHDWITEHPLEAHELGLVRHAWERT